MSSRKLYSVKEFLSQVKGIINDVPLFQNVALVGEISNFKAHTSGHFYFSLKDESSRISVVMFRSSAQSVLFKPKDGDRVLISGRFDFYVQTGQVQIYANTMNLDGLGDLHLQFERLKKELETKGYFDPKYKKSIPLYPKRIGVICGEGSAAYADITRTLNERWPVATKIDILALVQGTQAIEDISSKIAYANTLDLDVIILARGGGSIEDLWAFNAPEVVMAVFQSKTPIVTGIGHETDVTLSDYVSDYRAATPTAAAHYVTPDFKEVLGSLMETRRTLIANMNQRINTHSTTLHRIIDRPVFVNPQKIFDRYWLELDRINYEMSQHSNRFKKSRQQLSEIKNSMVHLMNKRGIVYTSSLHQISHYVSTMTMNHIRISKQHFTSLDARFEPLFGRFLSLKKSQFSDILKALNHLSPLNVMVRGYSVVSDSTNKVIKRVDDVNDDEKLHIRVLDGTIITKVLGKEPFNE